MPLRLLDVPGCPRCHGALACVPDATDSTGDVRTGTLRCAARRRVLLALVLPALVVVMGAPAVAQRARLTVYAAADLAFALKEIAAAFERTNGVDVTLVLGSTGNLAHQIEHGAPADVFFAANVAFIDRLLERGAVLRETRAIYAQGRIVLATAKSAGTKLTDLRQLTEPRVRRVAIANPLHAPYGKAAEEALQRVGVLDAVRPKLILAENIRQALQFIQTGSADAGIVALSVADVPEIEWVAIDPALHNPLNQAAAVVRRSAHPELANAFVKFVIGPEGRPIMKRFGFILPGEL
jgi:molybdate transport system substrate-binding protein